MKVHFLFLSFITILSSGLVAQDKQQADRIQSVHFESIKENQTFKSPFKVRMNVKGFKVRPAGEDINDKASGHHHIIINAGSIPEGQVIPADDNHLHYGKGQTEAEISLPKGSHTLTLQFANGAHVSYGPKLSKTVRINVKD